MVACSDLSPDTMKFIARRYLHAGKSMNFRPWSCLFALRTSFFISLSLKVPIFKVSMRVAPPSVVH